MSSNVSLSGTRERFLQSEFTFLSIAFLFIILSSPSVRGDNLTIDSYINDSNCSTNEVNPLSIYPLNNSHIAQPDYYPNKICISGQNITSSSIKTSCNASEGKLLRIFGFNDTHAGPSHSGYPNISCIQCSVNSTVRTNCTTNETPVISLSDNSTNAHVGEPGYYKYQLCVIKTNPDVSEGDCNCSVGGGNWDIGGEVDPNTCCEDDPNEFNLYKNCSGDTCNTNITDDACCDSSIDCVNNSICYSEWGTADTNSDQLDETCEEGLWTCNDTDIQESCADLGYPNGYCINDTGNCAPDYSLAPEPDKYFMPGENVNITVNFSDKEDDPLSTNISVRLPNNTTVVEMEPMNCSDYFCEYNFTQTDSLGNYDVKIYTEAGANYTSGWHKNLFSVNLLNLSMNFEEQHSGGGEKQNVYGKVWREPYHSLEERANVTVELENNTYDKCDSTNLSGEYSCEIDEPTYPREYKVSVSGVGEGDITGNVTDYLKIIAPRKVQVSMRLNFSLGSEKDKVYIGEEERNPGVYTKPEIDRYFACAEDSEEFSDNVFVSLVPTDNVRSITYRNRSSHYLFGAEERRLENKFLLTFSKGKCSDVSRRYEQIRSENFYNLFSPSIAYPTKEKYNIYVILDYQNIDVRDNERFGKGSWDLFIENNGTYRGNTQLVFNLLE